MVGFCAGALRVGSRLFDFPVGRGGFAARVFQFAMGLLDFTARLCDFGLGARDLSAGVRTELVGVGLRGQRGLRRFRARTFRIGSRYFDFDVGRGDFAARVV